MRAIVKTAWGMHVPAKPEDVQRAENQAAKNRVDRMPYVEGLQRDLRSPADSDSENSAEQPA